MFPKLITRYVTWELMKVFVISSAGFVLLMLLIGLAEEARDRGIGPDIVIQLIPYLVPKALMFAMPATCLFSVCVVFGRMAADNELTAIASMGLPKSVVVMPAILIAFALSLFAVWLNDISYAWSYWGVQRVVNASADKIIYGVLQQEGSFKTDEFSIEVAGVNDRELIQPTLTFNSSKNKGIRATAASATLESNPERHSLMFTMHNGFVDAEGKRRIDSMISSNTKSPCRRLTKLPRHSTNRGIYISIRSMTRSINRP